MKYLTVFIKSLVVLIVNLLIFGCSGNEEIVLHSPDTKIKVIFMLEEGRPQYMVQYKDITVIDTSLLGFELKDTTDLITGFTIEEIIMISNWNNWERVWGEVIQITDHHNKLSVRLKEKIEPHRELHLEFKAFNDGIGFRYIFPEQEGLTDFQITNELTQFRFTGDHSAWWIPGDFDSYEYLYRNTPLSEIESANTPVTFETNDNLYLSIHEANLTDYAGMTLEKDTITPLTLHCNLVPWPDGVKVKVSAPHKTPWRTIQIATNPGDLITSHLILNLNEPNVIEDVSWIKPMKYVGIWWGMHIGKNTWHTGPNHGATTAEAMRYIDFAAKNDISGLLIEGWNKGWESWFGGDNFDFISPYDDFDLEEVVKYAKNKGVKIIGHHETGGNIPLYERYIDKAFDLYQQLGIQAVKTGYAGTIRPEGYYHHGQWMVNHYRMVVEKAAEHKIMINVHEPIKPTGTRRTYPNMMTREGVRGQEFNAWSDGNPPRHTCILPFTRMLAGPLDYTPGILDLLFEDYEKKGRVHSTLAHQLALFVVLYSPMQMAADLVENYLNHPAFQFIKDVPCNWDDQEVLNGSIGNFVTIARQKGDNWFIGSITDENARQLTIELSFLEEDTEYNATIYADGSEANWKTNPYDYEILKKTVKKDDKLILRLSPGGGQAIVLEAR